MGSSHYIIIQNYNIGHYGSLTLVATAFLQETSVKDILRLKKKRMVLDVCGSLSETKTRRKVSLKSECVKFFFFRFIFK